MTMRRSTHVALGLVTLAALGAFLGCDAPHYPYPYDPGVGGSPPEPDPFPQCGAAPACDSGITVSADSPALMITDPAVLAKVPLKRVLDQLIEIGAAPVDATETMQRLFDTMNDTAGGRFPDAFHCDDPTSPAFQTKAEDTFTCPRAEGTLADSEGFFTEGDPDYFFPVAIVNRFDLTPLDGSRCGQYRIIYAKQSGLTDPANRVFLIFESALVSPMPGCLESCRPVAEFLKGLEGGTTEELAQKIDDLYFTGIDGFFPAVHPMQYGLMGDDQGYGGHEGGQIRVSMHMEDPWDMREMRLGPGPDGSGVQVVPATVKNSPAAAFFDPSNPSWSAEMVRTQLVPMSLPGLAMDDVAAIQMFTPIEVNGVESVLAGEKKNDYYAAATQSGDTSFVESIDAMITSSGYGAGCPSDDPFDAEAVLRRATALSCAGCHAPSELLGPERSIGCGLTWPDSIGQAHVTEKGEVSPALKEVFLPHRAEVLQTFLQACDLDAINGNFQGGGEPPMKALPAPDATLGGSQTH